MKAANTIDDKELLLGLQAGDQRAFTTLYERYYGRLYLHAYNKLRDREAAKDIIHDLFATLWSRHQSININEGLSSYLYKAVRNRIINYIARQHSGAGYLQSLGAYLETSPDNTDHLIREKQLKTQIEEEIAKLPPQVRKIFDLSREENLSHKEIAAQLGVTEQTVRWNVKSALKVLRLKFGIFLLLVIPSLL